MRCLILLAFLPWLLAAQPRIPVWIDTDPSVAPGGHEVDDGLALLQAFASPELDIRGVSIVFGNADLPTANRIGREIVRRFAPKGTPVYTGAASASQLGKATAASRALAGALRQTRLTILVLGPATNLATLLKNHPDLAPRIDKVIAVAGRRPGQVFRAGPLQKKPFRDLNFELDPEAFRVLLEAKVPLVLAPWEISSGVWLNAEDLNSTTANPGMRWLLPAAQDWHNLWQRDFGAPGFNPFDTLAVGYLVAPASLECERFQARIATAPDDTLTLPSKPYLLVTPAHPDQPSVTYCFAAKPAFKRDLLQRLSRRP